MKSYGHFSLRPCDGPFLFNDTSLIFALEYEMDNLPESEQADFNNYFKRNKKVPLLFKVDNIFADSLITSVGGSGLIERFSQPTDAINNARHHFDFCNGQLIYNTPYTDSLYVINPNTLTIEKAVHIHSEFGNLMVKPLSADQYQNTNLGSSGYIYGFNHILDIIFDSKNNVYYCFIWHGLKDINQNTRPWSLVLMDSNFKVKREIKMDEAKFASSGFISSGNHALYLYDLRKTDDAGRYQVKYTRFDYENYN